MKQDKSSVRRGTVCRWFGEKGRGCERVGAELAGDATWVREAVLGERLCAEAAR